MQIVHKHIYIYLFNHIIESYNNIIKIKTRELENILFLLISQWDNHG